MKTIKYICLSLVIALCACNNGSKTDNTGEKAAVDVKENVCKQEVGTTFLDISLQDACKKAEEEGKYVLVSFCTPTCGPCKKMKEVVFSTPECGEYVNKRFVTIDVNGEDEGFGQELAEKYEVYIFPTYLVLLPDGFREGVIMGAEYNVDNFIDMLKTIIHDK